MVPLLDTSSKYVGVGVCRGFFSVFYFGCFTRGSVKKEALALRLPPDSTARKGGSPLAGGPVFM